MTTGNANGAPKQRRGLRISCSASRLPRRSCRRFLPAERCDHEESTIAGGYLSTGTKLAETTNKLEPRWRARIESILMEDHKRPLVQGIKTFGIGLLVLCLTASSVFSQPVGSAYRIGPDDVLVISVWDQKDLDQAVFVRPDGKISLALVGEVDAGGQTVADLAALLTTLYSQTVKGARATVSIREIRSRPIYFIGGVGRPGIMQLTQDLTLLQALSAVGGPLPTADLESA